MKHLFSSAASKEVCSFNDRVHVPAYHFKSKVIELNLPWSSYNPNPLVFQVTRRRLMFLKDLNLIARKKC